jgi:ABC-type metal ion transport system substrate-binding protein
MKKFVVLVLSLVLMTGALVGCSGDNEQGQTPGPADQTEKLVVGATAKPHAEILEVVKPVLEADGVELEIKEFTDYVLINPALAEGQIDANFFQHIPYLDDYNSQNQADLKWIAKIHNEPMGGYDDSYNTAILLPNTTFCIRFVLYKRYCSQRYNYHRHLLGRNSFYRSGYIVTYSMLGFPRNHYLASQSFSTN